MSRSAQAGGFGRPCCWRLAWSPPRPCEVFCVPEPWEEAADLRRGGGSWKLLTDASAASRAGAGRRAGLRPLSRAGTGPVLPVGCSGCRPDPWGHSRWVLASQPTCLCLPVHPGHSQCPCTGHSSFLGHDCGPPWPPAPSPALGLWSVVSLSEGDGEMEAAPQA